MNRFALVACVVVLVGCGRKKPQEGIEPPPPQPVGSAAPVAAKAIANEEVAKRFDACFEMWNANKWDDFKGCFTADAVREEPGLPTPAATGPAAVVESTKILKTGAPDLKAQSMIEIVDGGHLFAVTLISGTHTAPLKLPTGDVPASNKKLGIFVAQAFEFDEQGHAKHEWDYYDLGTVLGQIGAAKTPVRPATDTLPMAKVVVVAKHDDKEKANQAVVKAAQEAFNKHDAKALGDQYKDDMVWTDVGAPKDVSKKEYLAALAGAWKAMADLQLVITTTWAAGDYVVAMGAATGTVGKKMVFNGPFFALYQLDGGKIKSTWVFTQSYAATNLTPAPAPAKP